MIVAAPLAIAATSSTLDILPDSAIAPAREPVELGTIAPLREPKPQAARPPVGNPLWAIPLSALSATQQRPIFSASRRPPPPAIAGPPAAAAVVAVDPPAPPEQLQLALIGAVIGESDAIAVFFDHANQGIVRLRSGQSHRGWLLDTVAPREVTLTKAGRAEVLALQRFEAGTSPPQAVTASPMVTAPPLGRPGPGFAPFTPRSTPKDGQSDGL